MRKLFNYGCAAIASSLVVGNAVAQSQKRMDKDRPKSSLGSLLIPGTTKNMNRLEENIKSIDVKILPEELGRINEMLNSIPVSGERYPAELAKRVGK